MGKHIIGICGSLRRDSFNRQLLNAAATALQAQQATFVRGEYADFPLYNQDVMDAGVPAAVTQLAEQVRTADGIVIASPEYNYGIPGPLKNALDWLSRLDDHGFSGKPLAILSASPGMVGGARMQLQLRQCLIYLNPRMLNTPEVMVGGVHQKSEDGAIVDAKTLQHVERQMQTLLAAI